MVIPLLLLSDEEPWLLSQMRGLTAPELSWNVLEPRLGALPSEGVLVVATDDVYTPRLRTLLTTAIRRLGGDHCLFAIWGQHPDLRPLRGHLPGMVIYLPAEAQDLVNWARAGVGSTTLQDLTRHLRRDLPPALRLALLTVVKQSSNPFGQPPPPTVSALARQLKLSRSNLTRQAKSRGVDLRVILLYARARWVLGRAQQPADLPTILRALRHTTRKPLGRLLRRTVGCTPSEAWRTDPTAVTGPLLEALGDTVDLSGVA